MTTEIVPTAIDTNLSAPVVDASLMETVLLRGDLAQMKPAERMNYYRAVCNSLGLNPLTRPFDYLSLNGKTILYAKRECTEQLRKIYGITLEIVDRSVVDDVYVVTARAIARDGRRDESTGAVAIGSLRGEAKANALMKCETKAKRRVTLSICGLAFLDESEADSVPGAGRMVEDPQTGEFVGQDRGSKEAAQAVAVAKIAELEARQQARIEAAVEMVREEEPEPKKRSKVTGEQIDFLKHFADVKQQLFIATGNHAEYYGVLNANGFEKSSSIVKKDDARRMYKALCAKLNDIRLGLQADDLPQSNAERGGTA